MKAVSKTELLDQLENRVELQLKEIIKVYQNLDAATLLKPAPNGGWSIAQCIEHLNTYGRYYLPLLQKGLEAQKVVHEVHEFKSTLLGDYFARTMEPVKGMKKMKAFKLHIPTVELNAQTVIAEFIQQEEDLLSYLKLARNKDLNRIRIPISISGFIRMRAGDVFRFLIAHIDRHLVQASRNI